MFHLSDVPVQVCAVSVQPAGVIWAEAEVIKVTKLNVIVSYAGYRGRLRASARARKQNVSTLEQGV